ncbi:hypothetical protein GCM10009661_56880 [Catellatospora chokoriensis]|uniref:Uncharacterized protein n=1 Tax=Catellatospora chokoriensis TaxID=310353 RepID=A0A8J3NSE4_9ACTN|nr:hypothetical protein Cch02nite_39050 [Catellatospora chokoriensis]
MNGAARSPGRPTTHAATCLHARFDTNDFSALNGDILRLRVVREVELIAELCERGIEVTRDDELINALDGVFAAEVVLGLGRDPGDGAVAPTGRRPAASACWPRCTLTGLAKGAPEVSIAASRRGSRRCASAGMRCRNGGSALVS